MEKPETTRQQKIGRQIQKDLGEMFIRESAPLLRGALVTVTGVRMSPDLEYARIYLSVFPFERHAEVMASLDANNWLVRKTLGAKIRNQMRVVPELSFFVDDSFEYIDKIDNLLK
ncbi:MAG: 30S ribosome-binding factor RbfA [Alistipes sp.]|jgi:ribosome-binding factor A|nr:30S ribosome-binding factor RbfA [Alistipes sp.]